MLRTKHLAAHIERDGRMLERKTTYGRAYAGYRQNELDPDDPKPPDDRDWILEAMAVDEGIIFWSWARYVDEDEDEKAVTPE